MITSTFEQWIKVPVRKPKARLRLICFAHAGGGASVFTPWARQMPAEIELCALQMPGHEERIKEQPLRDWKQVVVRVAAAIREMSALPFALFGHSLGGTLAFEVARCFRDQGDQCRHVFISGRNAPHLFTDEQIRYNLPDEHFVEELRRLSHTPDAVLDNAEMLEIYLPMLRADFELSDTYRIGADQPISVGISVYGGEDDIDVPVAQLHEWKNYTTGSFSQKSFPGSHFFIYENISLVLSEVFKELRSYSDVFRVCQFKNGNQEDLLTLQHK